MNIKSTTVPDDGGYHVTVVSKDSKHGYHHNLVVITADEVSTNELEAQPRAKLQAMIKARAKKLHATWLAGRVKEAAKQRPKISDIVNDSDLGI